MFGFIKKLIGWNKPIIEYDVPEVIEFNLTPKDFFLNGEDSSLGYIETNNVKDCAIARVMKDKYPNIPNILVSDTLVQFEDSENKRIITVYRIQDSKGSLENLNELLDLVKQEEEFDGEANAIKLVKIDQ